MSAPVISLAAYRDGLRVDGLTLIWRGLRHALTEAQAFEFVEALNEARTLRGTWAVAGFVLDSDGRWVVVTGWDMGPARLSNRDAIRVCLELGRAARGSEVICG